jgi:dipeptide/tripeptide permease
VPPTGPNPDSFLRVVSAALKKRPAHLLLMLAALSTLLSMVGGFFVHGLSLSDAGPAQILSWLQIEASGATSRLGFFDHTLEDIFGWITIGSVALLVVSGIAVSLSGQPLLGAEVKDKAGRRFPAAAVEGASAALRVMRVFFLVSAFWALYDQTGSSWVLQAAQMDRTLLGAASFDPLVLLFDRTLFRLTIEPDQLQALNPILILLLVPLFSLVIYPRLARRGWPLTPLRRMFIGMFVMTSSFLVVALLELALSRGGHPSVLWQFFPYLLLTTAEVLISITGLEFAYTQAPRSMKSTIMSFWMLTVFLGNLLTAYIDKVNLFQGVWQFLFFAGLMAAVGVLFGVISRGYKTADYIEEDRTLAGKPADAHA